MVRGWRSPQVTVYRESLRFSVSAEKKRAARINSTINKVTGRPAARKRAES